MAAGDIALAITISAVDAASSVVNNIASSIGQLAGGGVMGALASGAVAAGTAVAGIGVESVKMAGDFQQSMTLLSTSAGESANNIKMVSDGILQMSTDTATSTDQLAKGMYMIESSGQHGADALTVLKTAAEGAKTENADLGTVAQAVTGVLTNYHLKATDSTAAMNGLIQAVADGQTHLQALSSSMGAVLPIASSLGVSFPQVAGAISLMTNHEMSAQQAAQNLSNTMRSLAAPNAVAQKSMAAVGLSAQELKDTLTTKGLSGAIQLIEEHVGKTFPAGSVQAVEAFKKIMGGATGYNTALMLGGKNMKDYEANIKNITDAMNKGGDSVMGWDLIQGNFNFQLDRAKAAVDALMISLGQKLLPIITPIVTGIANIIEQVTKMIDSFGGASQSGDAFGGILSALGINSKTFQKILDELGTTLSLLKSIFGDIGNIISQLFTAALQMAGQVLGNFVNNDLAGGVSGLNGFLSSVKSVLDAIVSGLSGFLSQVEQVFSVISPIFDGLASNAETWGSNFINGFGSGVMSALDGIVSVVMQVINEIANYLGFASPAKKGPGRNVHKWGTGLVQGLATGMMQGLPLLTDAAGNLMNATILKANATTLAPQGISHASATQTSSASSAANSVKPLTTGLASALNSGAGAVSSAANHVGSQLTQICHTHAQSTSACASHHLTTGLASKLHAGAHHVKTAAHTVGSHLHHVAAHAKTAGANATHHVTKGHAAGISAGAHHVKNAANALGAHHHLIPAHAKKAVATAAQAVAGALPQAMKLGENPVKAAADSIGKAMDGIKTGAQNAVSGLKALGPAAQAVKQGWSEVTVIFGRVKEALQQAVAAMIPGLLSIWRVIQTQLLPSLVNLWNTVKPFFVDVGKLTVGAIQASVEFGKWAVQSGALLKVWEYLVTMVKIAIVIISTLINQIAKALQPVIKQLEETFKTQLTPSIQMMGKAIQQASPFLEAMGKALAAVWLVVQGVVVGAIGGIIRGIGNLLTSVVKIVGGIVEAWTGAFTAILSFFSFFYDLFTGRWDRLGNDLKNWWEGMKQLFKGAWDIILGLWQGTMGTMEEIAQGFVDTIISYFQNLYDALVGHSIIPDMIKAIEDWFTKLVTFVPTLITKIVKFFTDGFNNVLKTIQTIWKQINQAFTDYSAAALAIFSAMWQRFQTLLNSAWNTYILGPLTTLKTNLTGWFNGLATSFGQWGTNLIKMFTQSITAGIPAVTQAATNVATVIKSLLGIASPAQAGPLSTADKWMPNLMTMFTNQIKAGTPAVTNATNQLATQVQQKINDMTTKVHNSITSMTADLDGVKTHMNDVTQSTTQSIQRLNNNIAATVGNISTQMNNLNTAMTNGALSTQTIVTSMSRIVTSNITNTQNTVTAADQAMTQNSKQTVAAVTNNTHVSMTQAADATTYLQNANEAANGSVYQSDIAMKYSDESAARAVEAMHNASLSQAQLDAAGAAEHASLIAQLSSRTNAQMSKSDLQASNAAANGSELASSASTASALVSSAQLKSSSTASAGAVAAAADATKSAASALNSGKQTTSEASNAHDVAASLQTWLNGFSASISSQLSGMQAQVSYAASSMVGAANMAAMQAAAILGHTTPDEGPMKDDDLWMEHFVDNLVGPMLAGVPRVASAATSLATAMTGAKPTGIGGSVSPSIGTQQPIVVQINMDGSVNLDGKAVGKYVSGYLNREIRVQGGIRNK